MMSNTNGSVETGRRRPHLAEGGLLLWTLLVVALLWAWPATAQSDEGFVTEEANIGRGFGERGRNVFSTDDVDQVNLFNGNLTLTIPIGGSYPVSESFSHGLSLAYNSNVWDYRSVACTDSQTCPKSKYFERMPQFESNAGLGWTVSLGRLEGPNYRSNALENQFAVNKSRRWIYISPDGSRHRFYDTFQEGLDDGDPDLLYTRDMTFLRMKRVGLGERHVEFPNGQVHVFQSFESYSGCTDPDECEEDWRLVEIRDPYTATGTALLTVQYSDVGLGDRDWHLTDLHGREAWLHFIHDPADDSQTYPGFPQPLKTPLKATPPRLLLSSVDLPAFGGKRAIYSFDYEQKVVSRGADHHPLLQELVWVSFLKRVRLPDCGSPTGAGNFDCGTGSSLRWELEYVPYVENANNEPNGLLTRLKAPQTGGNITTDAVAKTVEWDYGEYEFPVSFDCANIVNNQPPLPDADPSLLQWVTKSQGVLNRRVFDGNGTHEWTYTQVKPYAGGVYPLPTSSTCTSEDYAKEVYTEVVDPLGRSSRHYFSVFVQTEWRNDLPGGYVPGSDYPTAEGWTGKEYGLPITRAEYFVGRPGLFKSTETFDVNGLGSSRRRTTWASYEGDALPSSTRCDRGADPCSDANRRQKLALSNPEVASGDAGASIETANSNWDGFGHYRTSTVTADASSWTLGATSRTTTTNYTRTVPPLGTEPWLLNLYDERTVTEGGVTAKSQFSFEAATGFLERSRVLAGTSPGHYDVLTVRDRDSLGNVVLERTYGGDLQWLETGSLATIGLPPKAERRVEYAHQSGVRSLALTADEAELVPNPGAGPPNIPAPVVYTLDNTIDPSTGLVTESRDSAGYATQLTYDGLGRPVRIEEPNGGTRTAFTYTRPAVSGGTVANGATVEVTVTPAGTSAPVLGRTKDTFDFRGRVEREEVDLAGGVTAVRKATYDALGRLVTISEAGNGAPAAQVYALTRDPEGRPTRITRPDGTSVDYLYTGDRVAVTQRTAGVAPNTRTIETTTTLDAFGRIVQVAEPSGVGNAQVQTDYSYDVGGRLSLVSTTAEGVTQKRELLYDRRGFLLCESHPELAASGQPCAAGLNAGTVRYSDHDASGSPGTRLTAGAAGPGTTMKYDPAGRLVQVADAATGDLWAEYYYSRNHTGPDGGKLNAAKRHHGFAAAPFSGLDRATVREVFKYDATSRGRLKKHTVRSTLGTSFDTTFQYDALGNPTRVDYPSCTGPDCAGWASARTAVQTYDHGSLSKVTDQLGAATADLATTFTYYPSGLLASFSHGVGAGLVDRYPEDPSHMPRFGGVRFEDGGGQPIWDLGTMTYDARGNISAFGQNSFTYDDVDRLTGATLGGLPGGPSAQTASYDAYGNLLTLTTGGVPRLDCDLGCKVDPATNRLTSATGVTYDAAGNVTKIFGLSSIAYDPLRRPSAMLGTGVHKAFLYTADGNRLAVLDGEADSGQGAVLWTLRGGGAKVLREMTRGGSGWTWEKDYVYRGSQLLASDGAAGRRHFHLDHLGSTRLVTDDTGAETARYSYFPYGEIASQAGPDAGSDRLLFTGHERDFNCPDGTCAEAERDDLDYMLARFYTPVMGRFLSMDEVVGSRGKPQSWNRYGYASGNPTRRVDPDGRDDIDTAAYREERIRVLEGRELYLQYRLDDRLRHEVALSRALEESGASSLRDPDPNSFVNQLEPSDGDLAALDALDWVVGQSMGLLAPEAQGLQKLLFEGSETFGEFLANQDQLGSGKAVGIATTDAAFENFGYLVQFASPRAAGALGFGVEVMAEVLKLIEEKAFGASSGDEKAPLNRHVDGSLGEVTGDTEF